MNIDINRVNLLEKDIEDWLYQNPGVIKVNGAGHVTKWLGRQYELPSGIADLVGVMENHSLAVIEVKNVPINKAAVLQVIRYGHDLSAIATHAIDGATGVLCILIGPSIDDQTFTEASACYVEVITFAPKLTLGFRNLEWSEDYLKALSDRYETIAYGNEWDQLRQEVESARAEYEKANPRPRRRYSSEEPPAINAENDISPNGGVKNQYIELLDELFHNQNDAGEGEDENYG
jgi:hypothetical protein